MARAFPDRLSEDTPSYAERRLFDALRDTLDDTYTIFGQVAWLRPRPGQRPVEGEADLLLVREGWGMVVVEVKGGVVTFDPHTGWVSNAIPIKDPVAQARSAAHELSRLIAGSPMTSRHPFPYGHAVWFPDADTVQTAVTLDARPEVVLGADAFEDLAASVEALFSCWFPDPDLPGPSRAAVDALAGVIGRAWTFRPTLAGDMRRDATTLDALTQQQYALLSFLGARPRALIVGCAGSGKTSLAVEKCRRLAAAGFRVLFTCFNRNLATRLAETLADVAETVDVVHFHELCDRLGREAGLDLLPPDQPTVPSDYFTEQLPAVLADAVSRLGPRYDALVVDEGQDFDDVWWIPLLDLLHDPAGGVVYIFYDDRQDIYGRGRSWPVDGPPFRLTTNCRNTRSIHSAAIASVAAASSIDELTCAGPPGRPVECVPVSDPASERDALRRLLHRLVHDEAVAPNDIVILTPRRQGRSGYTDGDRIAAVQLTWSTQPAPGQVRVSTIHSFKGLESPVVILTELEHLHPRLAAPLQYVARSRAISYLVEFGPASPSSPAPSS